MLRSSASPRRVLGIALAVAVGTGIGLGAYSLGSASGADVPQVPRLGVASTAATTPTTAAPAPAGAPTSSPLTLDEATAVAAQVAPGRVVGWDEDREPTGLRYDITLLHDDGSTTDVEVDTITGQVTSINHDNDWD
jgi:uncharacterized membrane protein YkoI